VRLDGIDVESVSLAPQRERTLSAQPVAARRARQFGRAWAS
jgi:hypothetical protein